MSLVTGISNVTANGGILMKKSKKSKQRMVDFWELGLLAILVRVPRVKLIVNFEAERVWVATLDDDGYGIGAEGETPRAAIEALIDHVYDEAGHMSRMGRRSKDPVIAAAQDELD